jgi:hypothetical protein
MARDPDPLNKNTSPNTQREFFIFCEFNRVLEKRRVEKAQDSKQLVLCRFGEG